MTVTGTRSPAAHVRPTAVVGSVAWAALAVLLVVPGTSPAALLAVVIVAAAALCLAVVPFVRSRPAARRTGVLIGLLSPFLALAALTPLIAVVGPIAIAVVAAAVALELAVLAAVARR
ncbi:hypothetical protein [Rathayibacter sp. VKM Ac-2630]|uniref:hypothetical protein n=1 Tax=Rathayibacter sp. VKM Ac-2630 TaxID=1938617 RepID=UPI000981F5F4|nr:hypothetical protein [Rathayibacter sp. VKM Ac-2630]OOB90909.1 hypothetical protein B0T42_09220 [Rathayibacter sp. VKM Ac-2630]